ncbi:hypothetical protein RJ639_040655 [Escallonia herrerae]|uniref:Pectate lyase n=1 Tax=Escallonia herrerae TaxID=1293975 RepID=A0AA88WGF9_9ASTE|nr:hypothetical protein RJ639_040655 [Escallonia herrerae]
MAAFVSGDSALFFFFLLSFAIMVPQIQAGTGFAGSGIAELDDFLKVRAHEAREAALKAYSPNPEKVTEEFNEQVGEALEGANITRRHLKENKECKATNPIDRCWRCRPNWARNRKRLADCARGFGHHTTGGKAGRFYVVTDASDSDVINPKPGTLRHAVIQEEPLWIIFKKSMVITLQQELMLTSHKTIDGRGANVHIAYGGGITVQFVENVIIHNIRIHHIVSASGGTIRDSTLHLGLRTQSDGDGISLFGATHVWIDHVSMSRCKDGLIDAIMASTAITISNCKFNNHNSVMLLGASDGYDADKIMQATVAFNRFGKGLVQRMPRCRWGFFHIVNNDYNRWEMYAIGGSSQPVIISQGNRFKASNNPHTKEVTKREIAPWSVTKNWQWRSEGDLFKNGAFFVESGPPLKHTPVPEKNRKSMIKFKPGSFVGRLTRYAGQIKCNAGRPC